MVCKKPNLIGCGEFINKLIAPSHGSGIQLVTVAQPDGRDVILPDSYQTQEKDARMFNKLLNTLNKEVQWQLAYGLNPS